jgi:serine/threonine-protein kinase
MGARRWSQSRFSADPQRLHRLQQEARAAAALNHPHIVTIHSVEVNGVRFITTELVEGKTLGENASFAGTPSGRERLIARR